MKKERERGERWQERERKQNGGREKEKVKWIFIKNKNSEEGRKGMLRGVKNGE